VVGKKVVKALQTGLKAVWCIGEKLEHREAGSTFQLLKEQLDKVAPTLKNTDFANIVIAYEPVWVIFPLLGHRNWKSGHSATSSGSSHLHQELLERIRRRK
jgi:triosephosphate isomerase